MKKNSVILLALGVALALPLTSCNGTTNSEEKVDIINTITKLSTATVYNAEANVPFALYATSSDGSSTTYASGITTEIRARSYAIEYDAIDNSEATYLSNFGYANYETGVMEYSYDDDGEVVPGYVVDSGKTIQESETAKLLDFSNIAIPSVIKEGEKSVSLDIATSTVNVLCKKLVSDLLPISYTMLVKQLGTISSVELSCNDSGDELKIEFVYEPIEEGEESSFVTVRYSGLNSTTLEDLEIKNYLDNGGVCKEVCDEAKTLYNLTGKSFFLRFDYTENVNGIYYSINYPFAVFEYNNNYTYTTKTENTDGTTTTTTSTTPSYDLAFVPVYGYSYKGKEIPDDIYILEYENGKLDTSVFADSSTYSKCRLFGEEYISSYAPDLSTAISLIVGGFISGYASGAYMPYLGAFSILGDENNLYKLGDYGPVYDDDDGNEYSGFYSLDSTFVDELDNVFGWSSSSYTSQYGSAYGGVIQCSFNENDESKDEVSLGLLTSGGYILYASTFAYTNFNDDDQGYESIISFMNEVYPSEE